MIRLLTVEGESGEIYLEHTNILKKITQPINVKNVLAFILLILTACREITPEYLNKWTG